MNRPRFRPKLIEVLQAGYTRRMFVRDLGAGITVGLVALPLAMAFGIASGVSPQAGIYTAVTAGFIISALGGSRCQIGGPTGAFVVIISGIIARHGLDGLLMVTMMAGVILVVLGFTGLGSAVRYIPRPVTVGFTNGISVLIATTQLKDFFGLQMDHVPSEFAARMRAVSAAAGTASPAAFALSAVCLIFILALPKLTRRLPPVIVVMAASTAAAALFHLPVETIATRFGGIPTGLPKFAVPAFRADLIPLLLPSAVTVALLAAIESLLSAVVADTMSGDRHDPNTELVAQGIANIATPLVGGIPATGAIARTAANIRSGAVSPVSGMVHSLTLLLVLLAAAPLARYIPLSALAAALLVVGWNMGEWREVGTVLRLSRADIAVWLATFLLTVAADLTVAVEVGMLLAALLYIYRVSQTTTVSLVDEAYIEDGRPHILQDKPIPPYVSILRIHGPFLFGAAEKLAEETQDLGKFGEVVVLRLRNMTALDATGLHALESFAERLRSAGKTLVVCGARDQPGRLLQQAGFAQCIGAENITTDIGAALERARAVVESRR
jgi:SulP family sulfate permease